MARWPHDDVHEGGKTYPEGIYKLKVTKQEDAEDKEGRFCIFVNTRIMEPSSFKGQPYNFRFMIGVNASTAEKLGMDDEDLEATNEETWVKNPSAARYKGYLKAMGVAATGDTEEEAEDAKDKVFFVQNAVRDGKYNDQAAFYADDGVTVASRHKEEKASPLKKSAPTRDEKRPAKREPAPAEEPSYEEEEWE